MWQEVHCCMAVRKVWYILGQHCRFNGSISYTKYFLETLKVVYYFQEVPFVRYVGWLILEIASLEKKPSCSNPQMNRKSLWRKHARTSTIYYVTQWLTIFSFLSAGSCLMNGSWTYFSFHTFLRKLKVLWCKSSWLSSTHSSIIHELNYAT